jgi:putative oxidoreductase
MIPMLSEGQREMLRGKGTMLGRMLIGLLFFFSGLGIVVNGPANTVAFFESLNIPLASIAVWPVIILKLAAGGMLIAGYRVGIAAGALILFTLLTTLIAHMDINDPGLFKNLAIVGGLLYVMAYGAGESWKFTSADPLAPVMSPRK